MASESAEKIDLSGKFGNYSDPNSASRILSLLKFLNSEYVPQQQQEVSSSSSRSKVEEPAFCGRIFPQGKPIRLGSKTYQFNKPVAIHWSKKKQRFVLDVIKQTFSPSSGSYATYFIVEDKIYIKQDMSFAKAETKDLVSNKEQLGILKVRAKGKTDKQRKAYLIEEGEKRTKYRTKIDSKRKQEQLKKAFATKSYKVVEEEGGLFLYITSHHQGDNLERYLDKNKNLTLSQRGQLFYHMLNALELMMELGIIHRDVKPENMSPIVEYDHGTKTSRYLGMSIFDFGLSVEHPDDLTSGTPMFFDGYSYGDANSKNFVTTKSDWYSSGVAAIRIFDAEEKIIPFKVFQKGWHKASKHKDMMIKFLNHITSYTRNKQKPVVRRPSEFDFNFKSSQVTPREKPYQFSSITDANLTESQIEEIHGCLYRALHYLMARVREERDLYKAKFMLVKYLAFVEPLEMTEERKAEYDAVKKQLHDEEKRKEYIQLMVKKLSASSGSRSKKTAIMSQATGEAAASSSMSRSTQNDELADVISIVSANQDLLAWIIKNAPDFLKIERVRQDYRIIDALRYGLMYNNEIAPLLNKADIDLNSLIKLNVNDSSLCLDIACNARLIEPLLANTRSLELALVKLASSIQEMAKNTYDEHRTLAEVDFKRFSFLLLEDNFLKVLKHISTLELDGSVQAMIKNLTLILEKHADKVLIPKIKSRLVKDEAYLSLLTKSPGILDLVLRDFDATSYSDSEKKRIYELALKTLFDPEKPPPYFRKIHLLKDMIRLCPQSFIEDRAKLEYVIKHCKDGTVENAEVLKKVIELFPEVVANNNQLYSACKKLQQSSSISSTMAESSTTSSVPMTSTVAESSTASSAVKYNVLATQPDEITVPYYLRAHLFNKEFYALLRGLAKKVAALEVQVKADRRLVNELFFTQITKKNELRAKAAQAQSHANLLQLLKQRLGELQSQITQVSDRGFLDQYEAYKESYGDYIKAQDDSQLDAIDLDNNYFMELNQFFKATESHLLEGVRDQRQVDDIVTSFGNKMHEILGIDLPESLANQQRQVTSYSPAKR